MEKKIPEEICRGQDHLSLLTKPHEHRIDGQSGSGILRLLLLRSDLNLVGWNAFGGGGDGRFFHRNLVSKTTNLTFDTFTTLEKKLKFNWVLGFGSAEEKKNRF